MYEKQSAGKKNHLKNCLQKKKKKNDCEKTQGRAKKKKPDKTVCEGSLGGLCSLVEIRTGPYCKAATLEEKFSILCYELSAEASDLGADGA